MKFKVGLRHFRSSQTLLIFRHLLIFSQHMVCHTHSKKIEFLIKKWCCVKVPQVDQHNDTKNQYNTQYRSIFNGHTIAEQFRAAVALFPALILQFVAFSSISVEQATASICIVVGIVGILACWKNLVLYCMNANE